MTLSEFIDLGSVLIVLIPLILKLFIFVGQKTHSQKIQNLSQRAGIIVNALEQSGMMNEDKKSAALSKLSIYAKEVGIKVTEQQLDDYIESAVRFMKAL